jgi:hypothetical protein
MNNNILIKKITKLLNSHFNAFLKEFFLASVENIIKSDYILFYLINIVISQNENCKNVYKITHLFQQLVKQRKIHQNLIFYIFFLNLLSKSESIDLL